MAWWDPRMGSHRSSRRVCGRQGENLKMRRRCEDQRPSEDLGGENRLGLKSRVHLIVRARTGGRANNMRAHAG